jgi:hypothetical protein
MVHNVYYKSINITILSSVYYILKTSKDINYLGVKVNLNSLSGASGLKCIGLSVY